ncbi:MAG: hypothetical protein IJA62_05000 [Ruminococcus sp.]|nr:hypothetical protein [Ruminococcus sp.]
MLANIDIRTAAKEKGVRLWEIANAMNISEPTMTRMLRHELSAVEKEKINKVIDNLAK